MKILFTILCNLCACSAAIASLHPEPGNFGIKGEFLYLQPYLNSLQFAVENVSETEVKILLNKPKYKPAYRVEGMYAFDCLYNLHARFTYFNSGNNRRSETSTFQSPAIFTGTVEDKRKFRYYAVEAIVGRWLFDSCDFDLELGVGVLYSNIKLSDHVTAFNPTELFAKNVIRSTFWGVGPELTLNFQYPLPLSFCGTFSIVADIRGALLQSKTKAFTQLGTPDSSDGLIVFTIGNDPSHGVVPASNSKLGLSWNYQGSHITTDLELGYEWIYYQRALGVNNISFHGPYVALGVAF